MEDSTAEEFKIQIRIPQSPPKVSKKSTKENERPTRIKSAPVSRKEVRADFDGGCWEMINQDAIQILPPKPKIPTKPTTSCIKPTFAEKHKKGNFINRVADNINILKCFILIFTLPNHLFRSKKGPCQTPRLL